MKIAVLGCGRWGTFLAHYLQGNKNDVLLWGRSTSEKMAKLLADGTNEYLKLAGGVRLSTSLKEAMDFGDYVAVAINPHSLQSLLSLLLLENYSGKTFIICMKGFTEAGEEVSTVLEREFSGKVSVAALTGPGQPQDLLNCMPTCMQVDSDNMDVGREVAQIFRGDAISIGVGNDMIGTQIAAAAKNVLGIGAGMLDTLGLRSLLGAFVALGLKEVAELIVKMGGKAESAYGLSCLGEIEATFFSPHSRSRKAGIALANKTDYKLFAPGVFTSETILKMARERKANVPLFKAMHQIINHELNPYDLGACIVHLNDARQEAPPPRFKRRKIKSGAGSED